jgi:tetratricopeptide (TPR) repeat protein
MRSWLAAFAFILLACVSQAQDTWTWPDHPKNLQVLPKDTTGAQLRPMMIGFTRALGVRCSYCHKGEEGKPLSTYDFASDDNANKTRARVMLKMVSDVNSDLQQLQPSGDERIKVSCVTCHRGRPRPLTLDQELSEQYRSKGLQAALDDYAQLKQKFYGRGSYDFGEQSLNILGYQVLEKDPAGAIKVFQLNVENFPESANVYDSLAEAYLKDGDSAKAEENYKKSLALDPKNDNAKQALEKLQNPSAKPSGK